MAYEFLFANNATTTLAESVAAASTVLNLASGAGSLFPNPSSGQAFAVTLVDAATGLTNEITYCTSRNGDALTVIRGQEGTNAVAWSAGDTAANYITADTIGSFLQESDLNGYATEAWVDDQGFATENYVETSIVNGLGLAVGKTDPGYSTMPGGMIIQSGSVNSGSQGVSNVTFPIVFPSHVIGVWVSEQAAGGTWTSGNPTLHGVVSKYNNSFEAYSMGWVNGSWSGKSGISLSWVAVGY